MSLGHTSMPHGERRQRTKHTASLLLCGVSIDFPSHFGRKSRWDTHLMAARVWSKQWRVHISVSREAKPCDAASWPTQAVFWCYRRGWVVRCGVIAGGLQTVAFWRFCGSGFAEPEENPRETSEKVPRVLVSFSVFNNFRLKRCPCG